MCNGEPRKMQTTWKNSSHDSVRQPDQRAAEEGPSGGCQRQPCDHLGKARSCAKSASLIASVVNDCSTISRPGHLYSSNGPIYQGEQRQSFLPLKFALCVVDTGVFLLPRPRGPVPRV
jgi:hypothetical protein